MNKDLIMECIFFILFISFIVASIYYIDKQSININNIECMGIYCYGE